MAEGQVKEVKPKSNSPPWRNSLQVEYKLYIHSNYSMNIGMGIELEINDLCIKIAFSTDNTMVGKPISCSVILCLNLTNFAIYKYLRKFRFEYIIFIKV